MPSTPKISENPHSKKLEKTRDSDLVTCEVLTAMSNLDHNLPTKQL